MRNLKFDAPSNKICTTSSSLLLDMKRISAKPDIKFAEFVNISSEWVFLAFSGNDAELNKGTPISPNGGVFTMLDPHLGSNEKVNVIGSTGGEIVTITIGR